MRNENEVCAEVAALVERMGMFPEEFIGRETAAKWEYILYATIERDSNANPLTEAETALVKNKLGELRREQIKKDILEAIMQPKNYQETLNPSGTALPKRTQMDLFQAEENT